MKRLLCLLFASFLLNPFAPARAQSVTTVPGAGTYETGLGFIWTGVGVMSTAAVFCSMGMLSDAVTAAKTPSDDIPGGAPVYLFLSAADALVGAGISLAGLMMMLNGRERMDGAPSPYTEQARKGFGALLEVGGGVIAPHLTARYILGSHLNEHVFLGGGVGATFNLVGKTGPVAQTFAASRFTFADRKVAPHLGLDLGLACTSEKIGVYGNYSAGARVRLNDERSLWISSYLELSKMYGALGLRLGWSF